MGVVDGKLTRLAVTDDTEKDDDGLQQQHEVTWSDEVMGGQLATSHISNRLRCAPGHRRYNARARPVVNDDDDKW